MAKKSIEKTQPMPAPPPVEEHDDELEDEEEGDEHEEEEDEEEDEEEEQHGRHVVAHSTRVVPGKVPLAPVIATHEAKPDDPTWWAPHAVLGALIVIGVLGFFGVFTNALYPAFVKMGLFPSASAHASHAPSASASAPTPTQKPATPTPPAPKPTLQQPAQPRPIPSAVQPAVETFSAKHIVVAYKGSLNADPKVTRSKEDAKKRATEAHGKLKKGGKWDEIVAQYSDEVGAGSPRFGNLGRFTAATFDKSFIDAVRKLKKDEMSDVVETPMGYEIIVRTE